VRRWQAAPQAGRPKRREKEEGQNPAPPEAQTCAPFGGRRTFAHKPREEP